MPCRSQGHICSAPLFREFSVLIWHRSLQPPALPDIPITPLPFILWRFFAAVAIALLNGLVKAVRRVIALRQRRSNVTHTTCSGARRSRRSPTSTKRQTLAYKCAEIGVDPLIWSSLRTRNLCASSARSTASRLAHCHHRLGHDLNCRRPFAHRMGSLVLGPAVCPSHRQPRHVYLIVRHLNYVTA